MSFFLDALLIVICLAIIIVSTKRGFVRSLLGLVSKIVALIAAYTFTPALASFLKTRYILDSLVGNIQTTLRQYVFVNGEYNFSALTENIPDGVSNLLSRYGVTSEKLSESISSAQSGGEEALRSVSRAIADPVASMISTAAAFILIFFAACLVLWIVTAVINAAFKLPVLNTANTVMGFVFGVCSAVIVMFAYSTLVSVLVSSLGAISQDRFGAHVIESTLLVKFFSQPGLISIVQNIIS